MINALSVARNYPTEFSVSHFMVDGIFKLLGLCENFEYESETVKKWRQKRMRIEFDFQEKIRILEKKKMLEEEEKKKLKEEEAEISMGGLFGSVSSDSSDY